MPLLDSFFSRITDGKAVRVDLPLSGQVEKERINCLFAKDEPPAFSLLFPPDVLPLDRIDMERSCSVIIDLGGQSLSIAAVIERIRDPQTLELTAQETVNHDQLRNYFRVDAVTRVAASSVIPAELAREGETWRLTGETVDLSGSGLLCQFSEPLTKGQKVRIDLALPSGDMGLVNAVGHVVRCRKVGEQAYRVGVHFDQIDPEHRDRIMASCFEIQRQHLRMKVQLKQSETI